MSKKNEPLSDPFEIDQLALGFSLKKLIIHYPKAIEKTIPLSKTGVHSRTYFDWKEKGLVEGIEETGMWIRLDLVDYCWVSLIKILRLFGVPIKNLLELKESIFQPNELIKYINDPSEIITYYKNKELISADKLLELTKNFEFLKENVDETTIRSLKISNPFASMIFSILISNQEGYIRGYIDTTNETIKFLMFSDSFLTSPISLKQERSQPIIQVPLKKIIQDIFTDVEMEKNIYALGLINDDERKIIDIVRKGDFHELIIKKDKDKTIIESIKDKSELNKKAEEIIRLLGMNEYDELTLKYRNKKDIFIRNKRRIK